MSTRDDITPTNREPVETHAVQLEALRKHPADADLYRELRTVLRKAGRAELLAEACELHAPHQQDAARQADAWAEAGEARLLVGQTDEAEADLRRALAIDGAHERAAARLAEHLAAVNRHAEAAQVIEAELAVLGERATEQAAHSHAAPEKRRKEPLAARRAERHRTLAAIWEQKLGRVDRALYHWQKAWQLEPEKTDALEAARQLYHSLGDENMVARLYEMELEVLGDGGAKQRRAAIELALGRIHARRGDAMKAANHLEVALRLDGESTAAREALAEVYASPSFEAKEDRQRRASELFVELGRKRMATKDDGEAIAYLRRALGVDPYSESGAAALEKALAAAERWDELDRLWRHRATLIEDAGERRRLLERRARLYEDKLPDPAKLEEVVAELAAGGPPHNPWSQKLRELYRRDQKWAKLVHLIEAETAPLEQARGPEEAEAIITELLEIATIQREHLSDRDHAAETLHRILSVDPGHPEALSRYADHFRERRDWRGLADLLEFAFDNARSGGAPAAELVRQLEEMAQVAELRLGDTDRAVTIWNRVVEIDAENGKAREAIRRLGSRAKMWQSLVGVLEQEAQAAQAPRDRAEAMRRIAQVYRERQVNPRRAISLYEEVVQMFPEDAPALKALADLYEREGDEAGLAHTLRRQLDLDVHLMQDDLESQGKRLPTAREWPVAKRVERLTALRRLAAMYEQRLADVEGVVYACGGILEILPGDRDALDRMERVLEKAHDLPRLEQTLEYHAAAATGPAEKAKVLRKLARLAQDREDEPSAMERWEQVLKATPADGDALTALADLYQRHERWGELSAVLERSLLAASKGGSVADPARAPELLRYARVVDTRLGDTARAVRAWRSVLEVLPNEREALDALARLYEGGSRWRELADILALQQPLYRADEPDTAAAIALQRARLLEERLGAPAEAARVLESILADIDPSNLDAHQALRRLCEARGDYEAAVRIAEREMYLTEEPHHKLVRGLEIGLMCRDRLGDPVRALQAFERVLELEPEHEEALSAAAELYAKVGDWPSHIRSLERRIEMAAEGRDRRGLMMRIAQVTADRIGDHKTAFRWWRRAHEHAPDATTIAELRRAAETYGLWRELAEVYEHERTVLLGERGAPVDRAAYVSACRELARLSEQRLSDRKRALTALHDAIKVSPRDDGLLAEAERIAAEADQKPLWKLFIECLDEPLRIAEPAAAVGLRQRRARVLEERLGDATGAATELLEAFARAPERDEVRLALYELAGRASNWKDVVAVESALLGRARLLPERVEVLRRKAGVLEDKLGEKSRAFRCHLEALLCLPEDAETGAHLWRLAKAIGKYADADKTPQPEPPAARIDLAPARAVVSLAQASATTGPPTGMLVVRNTTPVRRDVSEASRFAEVMEKTDPNLRAAAARAGSFDQTSEIDISEMEPLDGDDDDDDDDAVGDLPAAGEMIAATRKTHRADPTMELRAEDLIAIVPKKKSHRADPTMELRPEDLVEALGGRAPPSPPQRPADPPPRGKGPPPPPPRAPQIARRAPAAGPAPGQRPPGADAGARSAALPGMTPVLRPTVPHRAYESPWEELATAYTVLPVPDRSAKLRWLFRAADVWETGAADVDRAFDMLSRALATAPDDPEPRARLSRLAADHDAWDRLAALYVDASEEADTADATVALLLEVAAIRARQNRTQETEVLYRRILGIRPENAAVRSTLDELYRNEARWVDLAASLEEQTDPRLGTVASEAERPRLLRELATVYSEKLTRPHDAIDALARLRDLDPENLGVLREMAELFGKVGRWSKVIEVLHKLAEVAGGSSEGREAMRRAAEIYEVELELPDRAIDAYAHIVAQWADDDLAWAALDRLYESHARWEDLSETLKKRAGLARDPAARVQLLRRRARVLVEWLNAPEEAAAALRHARTIAPDDDGLVEDLIGALIKAGRAREAAAMLEGRLMALEEKGGAAGDAAALLIRLAALRADHMEDRKGARIALERALKLVPEHPTALATLARVAGSGSDPRAYAEARLREAEAVIDVDAKVNALFEAGTTLAEKCNDIDGARKAFEKVLALRPYHADAIWALAGLVEQGGDVDAAAALLEKRLEDAAQPPAERAKILTQLAALARRAGVDEVAERRLAEALEAVQDHLPAIIARADLLGDMNRWEVLEAFLQAITPRLESAPSATRAEMGRRLALAYEKQGRDDEAYQTLLAADRVHRGHLLVKLALGENRYRARRWREAALHLSACAEHADAAQYPSEVAEAAYHAALAEIRSLRPERAAALYERALQHKPDYPPALHALAELAMEGGNPQKAADLLQRQAAATLEAGERMRLFEALGDMALMTLHDETRARDCYQQAVAAAAPLEARHLPLMEKLLERQDLAGDGIGAARTAELMAAFGPDSTARAQRYAAAAEGYLTAGDVDRALAAGERGVEADPYDLAVATVMSDILTRTQAHDRAAEVLGRALSGPEAHSDEATAVRRALLWARLADARAARGDTKGATIALHKAVSVAPDSDGAMQARRRLLDQWGEDPERREEGLEFRRVLAADGADVESVAGYARALRDAGRTDAAVAMIEVAEQLGYVLTDKDRTFLDQHPVRRLAADEAYKGHVDAADRAELIRDRDDQPMAELLGALWEAAALLWSEPEDALERCGVIGAKRVAATTTLRAASMFPRVAAALETGAILLYSTDTPAAPDARVVCVSTPIVVVGPRMMGMEDGIGEQEMRFLLGRAAELARPERVVAVGLPRDDLNSLLGSLWRVFGGGGAAPDDSARHQDEILRTTLPVKLRGRMTSLLEKLTWSRLDADRFLEACQRAADRAGLLAAGELAPAIKLAGSMTREGRRLTRHLIECALSPRYLAARAKLGASAVK